MTSACAGAVSARASSAMVRLMRPCMPPVHRAGRPPSAGLSEGLRRATSTAGGTDNTTRLRGVIRTAHTSALDNATLRAARALLEVAFDGELTAEDWEHCLGGIHALAWDGD